MPRTPALVLVALATIVLLDAVWLGLLMRRFYSSRFAPIARMSGGSMAPIWPAAVLVYVLLAVGVVAFALPLGDGLVTAAGCWGALFGVVIYGFYNLTNHATLAKWPPAVTVVDTVWGSALCAATTVTVTLVDRWMP